MFQRKRVINARNKLCSLAHSHPAYSWSAARQDKENRGWEVHYKKIKEN